MLKVREELINDTLKSMMKNSKDFLFVKDLNYVYVGCSTSFAVECAGLKDINEVIGRTDFEIFKDKSFAEKYRSDDEELLNSKKPFLQYIESYPDKEGRKRYCQTTKYLITDDDGNPLGIMGQSYDITDKVEMEKNGEIQKDFIDKQKKIFKAMKNVYNTIVYFNYPENYYYYLVGESLSNGIKKRGEIDHALEKWMNQNLSVENALKHRDFFNIDKISPTLSKEGVQSIEVETLDYGWRRISLIPVDYDANGVVTSFLWVSEIIEKEIKTRGALEQRIAILNALKNIYKVCLYWDLTNNSYYKVAGDDSDGRIYINPKGSFKEVLYDWAVLNVPSVSQQEYLDFINTDTIAQRLKCSGVLTIEIKLTSLGWIRNSIVPVTYDVKGNVTSCLWVCECINGEKKRELEQKEKLKNAKRAAETDSLTNLLNRGGSEQLLNSVFSSSQKGLLFLFDVDEFKHINDRYGHSVGDMVLRAVADATKKTFRKKDIVARFGGDEFVVFVEDVTTIPKARRLINELLSNIEDKEMSIIGNERLRVSVGAILVKENINYNFSTAFQLCDIAMYRCKDHREFAYCLLSSEGETIEYGPHRP